MRVGPGETPAAWRGRLELTETRAMDWLQSNWIWIALASAFVAMHVFGHGGHGGHGRRGHGRHAGHGGVKGDPNETKSAPGTADPNTPADGNGPHHDG